MTAPKTYDELPTDILEQINNIIDEDLLLERFKLNSIAKCKNKARRNVLKFLTDKVLPSRLLCYIEHVNTSLTEFEIKFVKDKNTISQRRSGSIRDYIIKMNNSMEQRDYLRSCDPPCARMKKMLSLAVVDYVEENIKELDDFIRMSLREVKKEPEEILDAVNKEYEINDDEVSLGNVDEIRWYMCEYMNDIINGMLKDIYDN